MNVSRDKGTLLSQLRNIINAMYNDGRKPLRIYLTYAQMMALQTELEITHRHRIDAGKMELLGIPIQLTPPGSGMWVSCISDLNEGRAK